MTNDQRIAALEKRLKTIEASTPTRYQGTLNRKVDEDSIFDELINLVWSRYIYFMTLFEGLDRWIVLGGSSGSTSASVSGVTLTTGTSTNNYRGIVLGVPTPQMFVNYRPLRFRIAFQVADVSDCTTEVRVNTTAPGGSPDSYLGFGVDDGVVFALSRSDSSTIEARAIGSITDGTGIVGEIWFYPGYKAVYFVNGIEQGTITDVLPPANTDDPLYPFTLLVATKTNAARSATFASIEYIQNRLPITP